MQVEEHFRRCLNSFSHRGPGSAPDIGHWGEDGPQTCPVWSGREMDKRPITLEQDKPEVRSKCLDKWQPDPVVQESIG